MNLPISQLPDITGSTLGYLSDDAEFPVSQDGVTYKTKKDFLGGGFFSQTGNSITVSGTTSETTIVGGGVGSLGVPPNYFKPGDSFRCIVSGDLSSNNNDTITIRVKSDSIVLGTTGPITMPGATDKHFSLTLDFTIRTIGGPGVASIVSVGFFTFTKDASNALEGSSFSTVNNTTFDTTITNTLNITAQFSSTNIANKIYSELVVLQKTY